MASLLSHFTTADITIIWIVLLLESIIGVIANSIILFLYLTTKSLRTPMNSLFISLTIGDFTVSLFGTFVSFVFTLTKTIMGEVTCGFYGFITFLGGTADGVALTSIAIERYLTVARPFGIGSLSYSRAGIWLGYTWIISIITAGLPLVGISKYINEGAGFWCSIDWEVKNLANDIYVTFVFIINYFAPIVVIILSYSVVVSKVKAVAKTGASESSVKAEKAVTRQAIAMVTGFLVAWTPYACLCLTVTFTGENPFGPKGAVVPALFAKSSFCYNPFIYVALNKQFRKAFVDKFFGGKDPFAKVKEEEKDKNIDSSVGGTTVAKTEGVPTVSNNVDKGGPAGQNKVGPE